MNSSISGHHVELTPAMRQYAQSRIMSLKRRCEMLTSVDVTLTVEKNAAEADRQKACVKLCLAGKEMHLSHTEENMYKAIDGLRTKLSIKITRYNQRLHDRRRRECPKRELARILH